MFLATLLIVAVQLIEVLTHFRTGDAGILVFDVFPLAYLFQAVDVAMIILFGAMGVKEAYEVLNER
jgi:hypothetical protein